MEFPEHFSAVAQSYLSQTKFMLCVLLDHELRLISWNTGFTHILGLDGNLQDKKITEFLLDPAETLLPFPSRMSETVCDLTFRHIGKGPVCFHCVVARTPNECLILGEPVEAGNERILRQMTLLSNEMANINRELNSKNAKLQEAYEKIRLLSGIVPICAHCRKIRDDGGYWSQLESFLAKYSETLFSHGICPDCMKELYPEEYEEIMRDKAQDDSRTAD